MRELLDIVAAHAALSAAGRPSALATVVSVEGSAYRRPGARMLVAEDGRTWGGVSGGCLERDVADRARGVIAAGRPFLVRYDTAADEAVDRGVGTGCGGAIDVLIQPVTAAGRGPVAVLASVLADDTPRVLATVVRATAGWRPLVGTTYDATAWADGLPFDGLSVGLPSPANFSTRRPPALGRLLARVARCPAAGPLRSTETLHVQDGARSATVFLARVTPPQRLVLVGGGPDVVPVVRIAKTLGWRVAVVAARAAVPVSERFAEADERHVTGPDAPLDGVRFSERDAVVLMTHNLARDAAAVAALSVRPRFLGVLGPWHRSLRLLAGLPPGHPGHTLRSPVGLDVGADTPEEIALSIVAGVQAALREATGRPLNAATSFDPTAGGNTNRSTGARPPVVSLSVATACSVVSDELLT